MARVVKSTVTRMQAQKAAAAKKKKDALARAKMVPKSMASVRAKHTSQAKPLSKETKRYPAPKIASDQSKASMKRHVIGATRGKVRKAFPEIKTHDPGAFEESVWLTQGRNVTKSRALKHAGRTAAKKSKPRYGKRKRKTVS